MHDVVLYVEDCANRKDYEDFARFCFSVGIHNEKLQFNYVHPQMLLPNINPAVRNV